MIKPPPAWTWIVAAVAVLALAGGGFALLVQDRRVAAEAADARDGLQDEELIAAAKTALEADAPEAQSISFGTVFAHRSAGVASVCGAVDIVQPDDGFDGPERFVYSEGDLKREETDGREVLTQSWRELCV